MPDIKKYTYGSVSVEFHGFEDLKKTLANMTRGETEPIIRDALSAGGAVIKKKMETQAPEDTGWLESHFRVTNPFVKLRRNIALVWVGPSKRKFTRPSQYLKSGKLRKGIGGRALKKGQTDDNARSPAMIARQIEFGLRQRQNNFMQRAIQASKVEALERVTEKLKQLVRAWSK